MEDLSKTEVIKPENSESQESIDLGGDQNLDNIQTSSDGEDFNDHKIPDGVTIRWGFSEMGEPRIAMVTFDKNITDEDSVSNWLETVLPKFDETKQRSGKVPAEKLNDEDIMESNEL